MLIFGVDSALALVQKINEAWQALQFHVNQLYDHKEADRDGAGRLMS